MNCVDLFMKKSKYIWLRNLEIHHELSSSGVDLFMNKIKYWTKGLSNIEMTEEKGETCSFLWTITIILENLIWKKKKKKNIFSFSWRILNSYGALGVHRFDSSNREHLLMPLVCPYHSVLTVCSILRKWLRTTFFLYNKVMKIT